MIAIQGSISPIVDLFIFYKLSNWKFQKKDLVFTIFFVLACFTTSFTAKINDFVVDIFQVICILLFSYFIKRDKRIKSNIGAILFFEMVDLLTTIGVEIISLFFGINVGSVIWTFLILDIATISIIQKYYLKIRKLLNDRNNSIFIGLILYVYLSSSIVYFLETVK